MGFLTFFVRKDICSDLARFAALLKENGFRLRLESAYRPFEKQLSIWNRKARGELALLDEFGKPMQRPQDEAELMYAILTWSALPGASRHQQQYWRLYVLTEWKEQFLQART